MLMCHPVPPLHSLFAVRSAFSLMKMPKMPHRQKQFRPTDSEHFSLEQEEEGDSSYGHGRGRRGAYF